MQAYQQSTAPLTDYFYRQGLLIHIDAHGTPEEIFEQTLKLLEVR